MKNTFTLNRLTLYLITFLVCLGLSLKYTTIWKSWDYGFYKKVYKNKVESGNEYLSDKILIINVEKPDGTQEIFRKNLIRFIDTISNWPDNIHPKAVVLDVAFSNNTAQLDELEVALKKLKEKTKVYAVYNQKRYFSKNSSVKTINENDKFQAKKLYDSIFEGGRLHAGFDIHNQIITYPTEIPMVNKYADTIKILSIVKKVAFDDKLGHVNRKWEFDKDYVAAAGPTKEIESQTREFKTLSSKPTNYERLTHQDIIKDRYLVVGDLMGDVINDTENEIREIPGTYLLAWALNEQLLPGTDYKLLKQPLTNSIFIIGQTVFFTLFTILIFALIFKYIKRLQTKPKLIAVFSFLISVVVLYLYALVILYFNAVIPIGLTLVSMIIASILSWHFAYRFLATGVAEGSNHYDVFISYSHGDSAWVKKNLLEPLEAFRKPNGDKLEIFFDEKSITIGEAFTAKYMWGIVDSKAFIPVISKEYYGKNHCRNEMDLAYKRKVEKLLNIFPIAFSYDAVPEIYQGDIFADISKDEDFIEAIKGELTKF